LKHLRSKHNEKWADGEKAPPPIKNCPADPPAPPAQTEPIHPPSSTVTSAWVEPDTPVKNMNGVTALDLDSAIQSNSATPFDGNLGQMAQAHDPNQPMELCYKLSTTDFQDMPMELTKVFQDSGPLELCVRNDPGTEFSQLIDLTSANPKESHNFHSKFDLIDLSGVAPFQQQPMGKKIKIK
jgi:hypothetical protein